MDQTDCQISRRRLEVQGYHDLTDSQIADYQPGIRFAYALCVVFTFTGMLFQSIPILLCTLGVAFLASWLPRHPFDHLYNKVVRHLLHRPEIPVRSNQARFACGVATVWLALTIYLFSSHQIVTGWLVGGVLVLVGALVSTTDICIPSMFYNFVFKAIHRKSH